MPGKVSDKYFALGDGRWQLISNTRWNDGSSEPTTRHMYRESTRSPGRVELHSQEGGRVPVALQDDGVYQWRDWPGSPYPYSPPNIIRWWRVPGSGRWLEGRPSTQSAATRSEYLFEGPNTRSGGMPGKVSDKYFALGDGRWQLISNTRWNDGSSEPTTRHMYRESARSPGRVELHSQEGGRVPVALQDDGVYQWRDWPGSPYPYSPPNIIRWWRVPGSGRWLEGRP